MWNIIVLGDSMAGKSTLIMKITNTFGSVSLSSYAATVAKDTHFLSVNNTEIPIHDTSGLERWRELCTPYYEHANLAVIIFNAAEEDGFETVNFWREKFREENKHAPILVVGNKIDLVKQIKREKDVIYTSCLHDSTITTLATTLVEYIPEETFSKTSYWAEVGSEYFSRLPRRCW